VFESSKRPKEYVKFVEVVMLPSPTWAMPEMLVAMSLGVIFVSPLFVVIWLTKCSGHPSVAI
jgi:hypothetical protein